MPAKRHSATAAGRLAAQKQSTKRARGEDSEPGGRDGDAFFLGDSDDEQRAKPGGPSDVQDQLDEEEARETVEEKRHRLAKLYLAQLGATAGDDADDRRGVTGGSEEEGSEGEEEQAPAGLRRERLTKLLQQDAAQAAGRGQRNLAREITLPDYEDVRSAGTARRGHRLAATALALAHDDSACWTVSKDGGVCRWDMESGARTVLRRAAGSQGSAAGDKAASGPEWVKKAARTGSRAALHTVAVSSDGCLLAAAGGDRRVHVFDARTGGYVQAYPGHRDAVTALAFREGSHTLFSASLDRTVKIWSLDDKAYMDTLFGHQQEVLGLDVGRAERAVSCGADRSCRVWKIPEESQLIFKHSAPGAAQTLDCCRLVASTEWISGSSDGSLQLWTQLKRKPVSVVRNAHGPLAATSAAAAGSSAGHIPSNSRLSVTEGNAGAGSGPDVTGWVQSVASARGSDLVASGAGDGVIRLWQLTSGKAGGLSGLAPIGSLPARGWVNGLAVARSGRFVAAAVGQEPRLGRWARDGAAHNGLLVHRLTVRGGNE